MTVSESEIWALTMKQEEESAIWTVAKTKRPWGRVVCAKALRWETWIIPELEPMPVWLEPSVLGTMGQKEATEEDRNLEARGRVYPWVTEQGNGRPGSNPKAMLIPRLSLYHSTLYQWLSKCIPEISNITVTQELVSNAHSWDPPQPYWIHSGAWAQQPLF